MRFDTLIRSTLANNTSYNYTLGAGHLNGILLSVPQQSNVNITVRLRTSTGTRVLIQDMPVLRLQQIADGQFGMGHGATMLRNGIGGVLMELGCSLQQLYSATVDASVAGVTPIVLGARPTIYTDTAVDRFNELVSGPSSQNMFMSGAGIGGLYGPIRIDLGSVHLSGGSELDITVTTGNMGSVLGLPINVFSYSTNRSGHLPLQYETVKDVNRTFHNSRGLFAFIPNNIEFVASDLVTGNGLQRTKAQFKTNPMIAVYDSTGSHMAYYEDFVAGVTTFLGYELASPDLVMPMIWGPDESQPVPEDVRIRATGDGSDLIEFINIQPVVTGSSETTKSTYDAVQELLNRVTKLERDQPELAKALRHAGELPKSDEVAAAASVMETGDEE